MIVWKILVQYMQYFLLSRWVGFIGCVLVKIFNINGLVPMGHGDVVCISI